MWVYLSVTELKRREAFKQMVDWWAQATGGGIKVFRHSKTMFSKNNQKTTTNSRTSLNSLSKDIIKYYKYL